MTQTDKTSKKEQTQALTFANFSYLVVKHPNF